MIATSRDPPIPQRGSTSCVPPLTPLWRARELRRKDAVPNVWALSRLGPTKPFENALVLIESPRIEAITGDWPNCDDKHQILVRHSASLATRHSWRQSGRSRQTFVRDGVTIAIFGPTVVAGFVGPFCNALRMTGGGDVPDQDVCSLVRRCRADLGPESEWFRPTGYPDGLALCIIDSIQSTGSHYTNVVNVLNRYRKLRGAAAATDGTAELLASFNQFDGPREWASKVGNLKPASTRHGASLKAAVIHEVAEKLHNADIRAASQFREHGELAEGNEDRRAGLKKLWTSAEAQRSGITFEYALMLAGLPGVKSDRMVVRFVETATGHTDLTPATCAKLVRDAADHLGVDAAVLDHTIWRKASGRADD